MSSRQFTQISGPVNGRKSGGNPPPPSGDSKRKVSQAEVAFMVDCYLSENNFAKSMAAFRAEAAALLAPIKMVPNSGVRRLSEVLNDYISLKEEQIELFQARARMDRLFHGIQEMSLLYQSDVHSCTLTPPHPPPPPPPTVPDTAAKVDAPIPVNQMSKGPGSNKRKTSISKNKSTTPDAFAPANANRNENDQTKRARTGYMSGAMLSSSHQPPSTPPSGSPSYHTSRLQPNNAALHNSLSSPNASTHPPQTPPLHISPSSLLPSFPSSHSSDRNNISVGLNLNAQSDSKCRLLDFTSAASPPISEELSPTSPKGAVDQPRTPSPTSNLPAANSDSLDMATPDDLDPFENPSALPHGEDYDGLLISDSQLLDELFSSLDEVSFTGLDGFMSELGELPTIPDVSLPLDCTAPFSESEENQMEGIDTLDAQLLPLGVLTEKDPNTYQAQEETGRQVLGSLFNSPSKSKASGGVRRRTRSLGRENKRVSLGHRNNK